MPTRTAAPAIDTVPVDAREAARIEAAEARAWTDMYDAAPPGFAERAGLGYRHVGGALVLRWAATGRRYFSRTVGLGVNAPATERQLDDVLAGYAEAGIEMFLLQSLPHCRPAEYEGWLRERGLAPFDAQDRVVRGGEGQEPMPSNGLAIERVEEATADEWAEFLQRVYRLEAAGWLQQLVDRPGWHQYVARDGGDIVGARGMYIGPDDTAWLGMDGPVPGVHWDRYEPDAALCAHIVEDGLARGARSFIADIEAPSDDMDTPAYDCFARLGFARPYVRTHWARI
jgi:hypothetical protein